MHRLLKAFRRQQFLQRGLPGLQFTLKIYVMFTRKVLARKSTPGEFKLIKGSGRKILVKMFCLFVCLFVVVVFLLLLFFCLFVFFKKFRFPLLHIGSSNIIMYQFFQKILFPQLTRHFKFSYLRLNTIYVTASGVNTLIYQSA